MALALNRCGRMMKAAVDALSNEQKTDRDAVFNALGDAIEKYMAEWAKQLTITVGPTAGLGTTTSPGSPTGPGPAPVPLTKPPGGYFT